MGINDPRGSGDAWQQNNHRQDFPGDFGPWGIFFFND